MNTEKEFYNVNEVQSSPLMKELAKASKALDTLRKELYDRLEKYDRLKEIAQIATLKQKLKAKDSAIKEEL